MAEAFEKYANQLRIERDSGQRKFAVLQAEDDRSGWEPRKYTERVAGRSAAEVGSEPILHMRHFSATGELPGALVEAVTRPVA